MVPIDGTEVSNVAFYAAMNAMNKEKDHLYLICVIDRYDQVKGQKDSSFPSDGKTLLRKYGMVLDMAKIKGHTELLVHKQKVGEAICDTVLQHGVDVLIMCRKAKSALFQRILGSTTTYCVVNAPVGTVIIFKGSFGPAEEHQPLEVVGQLEEEERSRRLSSKEFNQTLDQMKKKIEEEFMRVIQLPPEERRTVLKERRCEERKKVLAEQKKREETPETAQQIPIPISP